MLPSFETQRLLVRPRTMVDFEACLVMDRDVEVTKHIPGPWHDPEKHEAFVRRRMLADYGPGLGYGTVVEKHQPNRFLGWILLIPADGIGPEIEIGWRLVREAWGRGYATEAAMPVIRHAFTTLKADRIMAEIAPRNTASLRVAQKLGLSDAGVRDDQGAIWRRYQMTQSDFASLEETGR